MMDNHCIEAVNRRSVISLWVHIANHVQSLRKSDGFVDLPKLARLHKQKGYLVDINKTQFLLIHENMKHFESSTSLLPSFANTMSRYNFQ
jgi:hypothetical protein